MIIERTFAALKYPKGSQERERLNLDPATSEFYPCDKYLFVTDRFGVQRTKTKAEAEDMQRIHLEEETAR